MVASLVYSQVQIMPTDPGVCFASWQGECSIGAHRAHRLRHLLVCVCSAHRGARQMLAVGAPCSCGPTWSHPSILKP